MSALPIPVVAQFRRLEPDYTALVQLAEVTLVTAFDGLPDDGISHKPARRQSVKTLGTNPDYRLQSLITFRPRCPKIVESVGEWGPSNQK